MKKSLLVLVIVLSLFAGCKKKELSAEEIKKIYDKVEPVLFADGYYKYKVTGVVVQGHSGSAIYYSQSKADLGYITQINDAVFGIYYPNVKDIILFSGFGEEQGTICEKTGSEDSCSAYEAEVQQIQEEFEVKLKAWEITQNELTVFAQKSTNPYPKFPVGMIYPTPEELKQIEKINNNLNYYGMLRKASNPDSYLFEYVYENGQVLLTEFTWLQDDVRFKVKFYSSKAKTDSDLIIDYDYGILSRNLLIQDPKGSCYFNFDTKESDCGSNYTIYFSRMGELDYYETFKEEVNLTDEDFLLPYNIPAFMRIYKDDHFDYYPE
ncbi:MAG: hypothetical protein LBR25_05460 [Erysipelotrichaceae bacterium]|jgi:hypothetical protein|nr:hypothetical protein [Erysipelotrichaceae bacterium]